MCDDSMHVRAPVDALACMCSCGGLGARMCSVGGPLCLDRVGMGLSLQELGCIRPLFKDDVPDSSTATCRISV